MLLGREGKVDVVGVERKEAEAQAQLNTCAARVSRCLGSALAVLAGVLCGLCLNCDVWQMACMTSASQGIKITYLSVVGRWR
jgi:hypothetical protein